MVSELSVAGGIVATTVAEAAAGDADALARIVSARHDDMARPCYVICGDADMAQDALLLGILAGTMMISAQLPDRRPSVPPPGPTRSALPSPSDRPAVTAAVAPCAAMLRLLQTWHMDDSSAGIPVAMGPLDPQQWRPAVHGAHRPR